mmetsp:Transcript_5207/g.8012  ORF Transcript_5207/g.8012 Transcript_5207/m.8012 type:complete len:85 (-) Transcript_5207:108-362(-)
MYKVRKNSRGDTQCSNEYIQDPAQHFCRATSAEDKIPLPGKSISDLYTCPWHFFHVLLPLLHLNKNFHRDASTIILMRSVSLKM